MVCPGVRVGFANGMRIYFMSICGTGMGNGALLMRSLGHEVMGADQQTYPPMSEKLAQAGIAVMEGYDAARLAGLGVDLVVVGNVNTRGNPEVEWLLESRGLPFVSLPELLAREILSRRPSVVITGTHGKTTTTSLAAYLLRAAGAEPGWLIGGVPMDLPSGAEVGGPEAPFVIEGDEYDSAFFDKRSKFIHYCPRILVMNNLEFDHADIFRDLDDIKRSFAHLLKLVPAGGSILINSDDAEVEQLAQVNWAPVLRVGLGERADLRIRNYRDTAQGSTFELYHHGNFLAEIEWGLSGLFNARNAAMALLATARALGMQDLSRLPFAALAGFQGVRRRQEQLHADADVILLSDFAHHPTAVKATLEALRGRYPGHRLLACFEARSNTACRNIHQSAFELAFDVADRMHMGAVYRAERYAPTERIDFAAMASRLGEKAIAHADNAALERVVLQQLLQTENAPCVCIFFSNGSFDGIPQRIADICRNRATRQGGTQPVSLSHEA